ncbi:MAG: hypothetical protein R3E64_14870 [Halioglobus sp.]
MKFKLVCQAALLLFSTGGMAATVEYDHPDLTIVAKEESLDSVLTALGKEMALTVQKPVGVNPMINCNIQNQPIERALKNLLGALSYSLVWADDGERLTGLVILAGDGESAEVVVTKPQTSSMSADQVASVAETSSASQSAIAPARDSDDNPQRAEQEARMETDRAEHEARMAEEREAREAEMEQRRQEEEIAHEARMKEEVARHEAEFEAYMQSQGISHPQ